MRPPLSIEQLRIVLLKKKFFFTFFEVQNLPKNLNFLLLLCSTSIELNEYQSKFIVIEFGKGVLTMLFLDLNFPFRSIIHMKHNSILLSPIIFLFVSIHWPIDVVYRQCLLDIPRLKLNQQTSCEHENLLV